MKKILPLLLIALLLTSCAPGTPVVRGSWKDNVYTNSLAGFAFSNPEGWVPADDTEVLSLMGLESSLLDNASELNKALLGLESIYIMQSIDSVTGANVLVMYVNLPLRKMEETDAASYAQKVASDLGQVDGIKYVSSQIGSATLAGEEYATLPSSLYLTGAQEAFALQQMYLRKVDSWIVVVNILLPVTSGYTLTDITAHFSAAQVE